MFDISLYVVHSRLYNSMLCKSTPISSLQTGYVLL